jgi:hypothetical protein
MTRKFSLVLFLAALCVAPVAADWRTEIAGFFSDDKAVDYRAAQNYLEGQFGSLSEEDKPVACGLLAFFYARLGDKGQEYRRLGEYFEEYGALNMGFQFLPPSARAAVSRYLRDWQLKYPWVMKIGIVASTGVNVSASIDPPERLILGIEMAGDVLYKFSESGNVIKGGMFHRGFNEITFEARRLFRESGSSLYLLEFKAGDLLVRRTLVITIQREMFGALAKPAEIPKTAEYAVKIFLGDRLLAASQRTVAVTPPLKLPVPPPSGKYDPFGPGYQNQPKFPSAIPLGAIPAVIKELIDAFKKRNASEPVPAVELKTDLQFLFSEKNPDAPQVEVRARLWLGLKDIQFLSFLAQK